MSESEQGSVYLAYVLQELGWEHDRRSSLQQRALALGGIGTAASGAVAAASVFAIGKDRAVPALAVWLFTAATLAFLVSTGLTTRVFAIGQRYTVATADSLLEAVTKHWKDSEVAARGTVAQIAAGTIGTLRSGNNRSAATLLWAGYGQILGLILLICAVLAAARTFTGP